MKKNPRETPGNNLNAQKGGGGKKKRIVLFCDGFPCSSSGQQERYAAAGTPLMLSGGTNVGHFLEIGPFSKADRLALVCSWR